MAMCNIWIFDVGRGLSAAIKTPLGKWIMIDLGSDSAFSPVKDFMLKNLPASSRQDGRREISQLIISHPHNDHISCVEEFNRHIYPSLLSVPNDNEGQDLEYKIKWELITNQSVELTDYLREQMLKGRNPPLKATKDDNTISFKIYYLLPNICENDKDLQKQNYTNNLSIVVRLNYKGNVILFCGDMMKDGMSKLLENAGFSEDLRKYGVDFLIAPHHGLKSSFSEGLFSTIKGNKTKLNIISEKVTGGESNEQVDDRYSSRDYAAGHLVHESGNRITRNCIKTSRVGHIRITLWENESTWVYTGDSILRTP